MLEVDINSMVFESSDGTSLQVLRDLYFQCPINSFTSIVGPSGCGKTTSLRCIMGLETRYDGKISVTESSDTNTVSKISAVFQEPRLLPWRTVDQNIRLAIEATGHGGNNHDALDETGLNQLFEELGLTDHRQFFPQELSLGLARRVALARAFAVHPSVLILDEPFVSLDEETASRLRKLLARVWRARSCTALMVTHNVQEAIELSDRILFFSSAPSSIVADYTVPVDRQQRDSQAVARITEEIRSLALVG